MRARVEVCGHGRYDFHLVGGTRHCTCRDCPHVWMIALGSGTTDYMPDELPGIAMRGRPQ